MAGRRIRKRSLFWGLLVLVLLFLLGGNTLYRTLHRKYLEQTHPLRYSDLIERYARERQLDPYLVYAVVKTESGFDEKAVSSQGARGLMQLMEDAFDWVKFRMGDTQDTTYDDMYNAEDNLRYGTYMLMLLMEEYDNNVRTTMAAYHAGRGQINKWLADSEYSEDGNNLKHIPISDTNHYVKKVVTAWENYRELYASDE